MRKDEQDQAWQPIKTAPERRKVFVSWVNALGKRRTTCAAFYPAGTVTKAYDLISAITEERDRLLAEIAEAMKVLAPNMPESGLVDACKQVKQVAISEADNSANLEAQLKAITEEGRQREQEKDSGASARESTAGSSVETEAHPTREA